MNDKHDLEQAAKIPEACMKWAFAAAVFWAVVSFLIVVFV